MLNYLSRCEISSPFFFSHPFYLSMPHVIIYLVWLHNPDPLYRLLSILYLDLYGGGGVLTDVSIFCSLKHVQVVGICCYLPMDIHKRRSLIQMWRLPVGWFQDIDCRGEKIFVEFLLYNLWVRQDSIKPIPTKTEVC